MPNPTSDIINIRFGEFDATTVLPPGWHGHVDAMRNLVLEKDGPRKDTQL